ncbi:MAG: hypothetical protein KIS76_11500 [Pyrinomonadaceae bacterium]|nr:hypothetical protein [Pyrinomonadaceae bacterium]
MFSLKMITFCKSVNCPSSESLLAYLDEEWSANKGKEIEVHLSDCEFCSAEVDFYRNYPQSNEAVAAVEIPVPLRQLAEALLADRHKDHSLLNSLLNVDDSLLLKKA